MCSEVWRGLGFDPGVARWGGVQRQRSGRRSRAGEVNGRSRTDRERRGVRLQFRAGQGGLPIGRRRNQGGGVLGEGRRRCGFVMVKTFRLMVASLCMM